MCAMSDEEMSAGAPYPEEAPGANTQAAIATALALSANASSAEAKAYLREQAELTRKHLVLAELEVDFAAEEDRFEVSHYRFRQYSDYAKLTMQVAVGFVVLLIVSALVAMVWNAARDRDLVVEAFSVPPEIAQTGMTGTVLATRVLDRYGALQASIDGTLQAAASTRSASKDDIRVQIPETGVSLGDVNRYLRGWLGNETHITGDVVNTDDALALTVRYGNAPGVTFTGKPGELDALVTKASEHIFKAAVPFRYIEYLLNERRYDEAESLIRQRVTTGSDYHRALAYTSWAVLFSMKGDMHKVVQHIRQAEKLDPDIAIAKVYLSSAEGNLGHEESMLKGVKAALTLWENARAERKSSEVGAWLPVLFSVYRSDMTGAYAQSVSGWHTLQARGPSFFDPLQYTIDISAAHEIAELRSFAKTLPTDAKGDYGAIVAQVHFQVAYATQDWAQAARLGAHTLTLMEAAGFPPWSRLVTFMPLYAEAVARSGNIAKAQSLIDQTAMDCDSCLRARAIIAGLKGGTDAAGRMFAAVSKRSPSIPFADTRWGAMLLRQGKFDDAIAKFKSANEKGPHYADPLVYWGEALMLKNRSDLALEKFAQAVKYAPNWGRLHLKWGAALFYTGDKAGAQKQFAIASNLHLTPQEKSELAQMTKRAGVGTAQQT